MVNAEAFRSELNIVPSEYYQQTMADYMQRFQGIAFRSEAPNTIFVPTCTGVLLIQNGLYRVFATDGFCGEAFCDIISPSLAKYESAETNGVIFCGVTRAKFDGYKLLVHAMNPNALRMLTARGFKLAYENDAELTEELVIDVYYNPKQTKEGYDREYIAQIRSMCENLELEAKVNKNFVDWLSWIVI